MNKPLLLLIDGNSLLHRAYHVMPPLTVSKTGEMIGAVYGFASMFLKSVSELKPTHFAIAFDKKGLTFRHRLYEQYKAHRPETPEELVGQFGRVRQLVEAFKMPIFELDGYEADDVLGSLSHQANKLEVDTIIVTGDADAMQLVSPRIAVFYPKPGGSFSDATLFDEDTVNQKYGVKPKYIADLKALVGDKSDNIPGVRGIGNKTAISLIQQFGSLDDIYSNIENIKPEKIKKQLKDNKEIASKSKELATIIVSGLPVILDLEESKVSRINRQLVTELFRELEFTSLLPRLSQIDTLETRKGVIVKDKFQGKLDYNIICTPETLNTLATKLSKADFFSFDTETTNLNPMLAQLVGISFSMISGKAFYIPVGHVGLEKIKQLPLEQVIKKIKPIMEDRRLKKIAHNSKYDIEIMAGQGVHIEGLAFDTMVAAYLMGEKAINLKALAFSRLGIEMTPISEIIGSGAKQICISHAGIERTGNYACADADVTKRLATLFDDELHQQGLWELFIEVEMPLIPVLTRMEMNGVVIDSEFLEKMSHRIGERLLALEREVYGHAGHKFNINSPRQLGLVLFDELKMPVSGRTKSGYSTNAVVLENLRSIHPIIELIIEYRQLTKLKSTYIDALPAMINPRTKRLHTCFNQTRTATGRLSSSEPNLQNIPVRGEQGKEIRQAFVAPPGYRLLSTDYSQIDLRVLAHLSDDPELIATFQQDRDIHTATAARLFRVSEGKVTLDMRRLAKTVNFGVIYGMSSYGLEQATELSREDASDFINAYFEKYPKVKQYMESIKQRTRESGFVQTLLNRKRAIPEINSANRNLREAAERMAINMPVQGTSADIIKVAMLRLDAEMIDRKMKSKMILQVHDELIFEVPEDEIEKMKKLVPHIMSTSLELNIPLKIDVKIGKNWGQME
jgi:DNA polymerase-1